MELASGSSEVGSAGKQHGQLAGNAFGDSAPVEKWRESLRRAMPLTKLKETILINVCPHIGHAKCASDMGLPYRCNRPR